MRKMVLSVLDKLLKRTDTRQVLTSFKFICAISQLNGSRTAIDITHRIFNAKWWYHSECLTLLFQGQNLITLVRFARIC